MWTDAAIYRQRHEKSAAALIALRRALDVERGPLGDLSEEFLSLYDWVSDVEPEHFTRLWCDPAAYYWVRRAVHFLAGCHGAPLGTIERAYCVEVGANGPAEALGIHLGEFKRFVLALAVLSGKSVVFARAFETSLPFSLPGTRFAMVGEGRAAMHGFAQGTIEVTHDGRGVHLPISGDREPGRGIRVESCPLIRVAGACILLNPLVFRVPGLGFGGRWTELPLEHQARHEALVGEAVSAIARFQPATLRHFPDLVCAVGLKPAREGSFGSTSTSELPGAFICSVPCDPYELAATFIHELHHNRLFFIEEAGPFFAAGEEDAIEGEHHYSPWRDTPRPLHGLLHALYVYLPVFRFWSALHRERVLDGVQMAYAQDQLGRIPFQLRIGVNQLRRHAELTARGEMVLERMAVETAEAESESRALGVSLDAPAMSLRASGAFRPVLAAGTTNAMTVGETLLAHLETRDVHGECAQERERLAGTLGRAVNHRPAQVRSS